jgi:hypothetical protein
MQETALPHRVVRSAKELVCVTLSGAFELNEIGCSKQAGTSSQTSCYRDNEGGSTARFRPALHSRGSGFRDEVRESTSREAEEDFDLFQELDDFEEWNHSEVDAGLISSRDPSGTERMQYQCRNIVHASSDTEAAAITKTHIATMTGSDDSISGPSVATAPVHVTKTDSAHTAALRRLHQIGAHLQNNLAMQASQRNAYEQQQQQQQHVSLEEQSMHDLNNATLQRIAERLKERHSDHLTLDLNTAPQRLAAQLQKSIFNAQFEHPPTSSPEKEKERATDGLQRQFHCPYYACHRNLKQLSTNGSSSTQRPCVHVGCDFQADTLDSWVEHVHVPHHDLLGSS